MKRIGLKLFITGVITLTMILLTGCQAVQNMNANKLIDANLSIQSSVSSMKASFELTVSSGAELTSYEQGLMDLFNSTTLTIDEMRMENPNLLSMKGSLTTPDGKIPIQAALNKDQLTLSASGGQKPVVIQLSQFGAWSVIPNVSALDPVISALGDKGLDMMPTLLSYLLQHAPNPKNISVSSANATVNGDSLALTKVHTEISGAEIQSMLNQMMVNTESDETGLRSFLSHSIIPVLKEAHKNDLLVNVIYTEDNVYKGIKPELSKMAAAFGNSAEPGDTDKQMSLMLDLFVDKDLFIRKSEIALSIPAPFADAPNLSTLKVTLSGEAWNINGEVQADKIDTTGGALAFDLRTNAKSENKFSAGKLINNFERNSTMRILLQDKLRIAHKKIELDTTGKRIVDSPTYIPPYVKYNRTMVPLAFVSVQLDAAVTWDNAKQEATVIDHLTGTKIVLTIGSSIALVNGKQVPIDVNDARVVAELKNNRTFVPINFIATTLGCKVGYVKATEMATITRD